MKVKDITISIEGSMRSPPCAHYGPEIDLLALIMAAFILPFIALLDSLPSIKVLRTQSLGTLSVVNQLFAPLTMIWPFLHRIGGFS